MVTQSGQYDRPDDTFSAFIHCITRIEAPLFAFSNRLFWMKLSRQRQLGRLVNATNSKQTRKACNTANMLHVGPATDGQPR